MEISIEERERIYNEDKIVRAEELTWRQSKEGSLKLQANVLRANGEEISLRGTCSKKRYSFALLYKNSILIRKWDFRRHTDPKGNVFPGPHKQPRPDKQSERWAYSVEDIPTNNIDKALLAFLKECNIEIRGSRQITIFENMDD